jgi:hypothetical protein
LTDVEAAAAALRHALRHAAALPTTQAGEKEKGKEKGMLDKVVSASPSPQSTFLNFSPIGELFSVRFAAKGVQQVKFLFFLAEMCIQIIVMGIR